MKIRLLAKLVLLLAGCTGIPQGITPVQHFELNRYLGQWHEIARLENRFEKGLTQVTAEYQISDEGVKVINRGYDAEQQKWKSAEGQAYFVSDEATGHLKVSFFGPFYGSYIIFKLDQAEYQYAFVTGYDKSYLWLLARSATVEQSVMDDFIKTSSALGFDTSQLIMVKPD